MVLGLKRFDAPVLRCPGMAKQKVGNPSLKPRLIFIIECKKIKLFICIDRVAVKE